MQKTLTERAPPPLVALVAVAALVASTGAAAQAGPPLTLDRYVERVLDEGLEARATATAVDVAAADVEATGLWPNPRVEVSRQANAVGVREGESQDGILVSLPLAVSGRLSLLKEAAEKDLEAARARLTFARAQLRREATAAFLDAIAARRRTQVAQLALDGIEPIVEAIVAREKAGESAGYDRVRIELERQRLREQLAAARTEEDHVLAQARALLGPDGASAGLVDYDLERPLLLEQAMADVDAVEERGDVRALALEAESAALEQDAAWRALIPEPTLFGGGSVLDLGRAEMGLAYAVGVEIPIPVFDRGQGARAQASARKARAEAEARARVHSARARLAATLALRDARVERARQHDAEVVNRAKELFEITQAAYQGGGAELLALVDAERALREARETSVNLHVSARRAENDALLLGGVYDDEQPASTKP